MYVDPRTTCDHGWITPADLCCATGSLGDTYTDCDGNEVPVSYNWTDDDIIQAVSDLLFARTCYRYPGECVVTVWPCLDCGCNRNPCNCGYYDAIELTSNYPILSVVSVEINGDAVDPSLYRLDENARIVRTDGERWPTSNNLGLTDGRTSTPDEVSVTYITGRRPPRMLEMAAADLVCELKKACGGDPTCSLPAHVRSVQRRGVEYDFNDMLALMDRGLTGLPMVDHALTIYGRCGRMSLFDHTEPSRSAVRDSEAMGGS